MVFYIGTITRDPTSYRSLSTRFTDIDISFVVLILITCDPSAIHVFIEVLLPPFDQDIPSWNQLPEISQAKGLHPHGLLV